MSALEIDGSEEDVMTSPRPARQATKAAKTPGLYAEICSDFDEDEDEGKAQADRATQAASDINAAAPLRTIRLKRQAAEVASVALSKSNKRNAWKIARAVAQRGNCWHAH